MSDENEFDDDDQADAPGFSLGNDSTRWQRLLDELDKKFQLGLLEKLRSVKSYHFEGNSLFIESYNKADRDYLEKPTVKTQLSVFALDAIKVTEVLFK